MKSNLKRLNHHGQSNYFILGDREAESVETGDAILIVTGKIKVVSYLLNFQNEGIILDGRATYDDQDKTSSLPPYIFNA